MEVHEEAVLLNSALSLGFHLTFLHNKVNHPFSSYSRTSLGTGRTIHSVGRVSRSSFYLPQTGGVPADDTPTLKSVGYRIRLVIIL